MEIRVFQSNFQRSKLKNEKMKKTYFTKRRRRAIETNRKESQ